MDRNGLPQLQGFAIHRRTRAAGQIEEVAAEKDLLIQNPTESNPDKRERFDTQRLQTMRWADRIRQGEAWQPGTEHPAG